MANSNIGKWDNWYKKLPDEPSAFVYSETLTYKIAAEFLVDCPIVEDWGCGGGGFLNYRKDAIGVDGSDTKFAAKKYVDLANYISSCDAVHMRHVLEHNYQWKDILNNAFKSAKKKIALTLFIPLNEGETKEVAHNKQLGVDVPDLSLSKTEFNNIINSYNPKSIKIEDFATITGYKFEETYSITL
jgi:hypothetical protein